MSFTGSTTARPNSAHSGESVDDGYTHVGDGYRPTSRYIPADDGYTHIDSVRRNEYNIPVKDTDINPVNPGQRMSVEGSSFSHTHTRSHTVTHSVHSVHSIQSVDVISHTRVNSAHTLTHTESIEKIANSGQINTRPLPQRPASGSDISPHHSNPRIPNNVHTEPITDEHIYNSIPSQKNTQQSLSNTQQGRDSSTQIPNSSFRPPPRPERLVKEDEDHYATFLTPDSLRTSVRRISLQDGVGWVSKSEHPGEYENFSLSEQVGPKHHHSSDNSNSDSNTRPKNEHSDSNSSPVSPDLLVEDAGSLYTTLDGISHSHIAAPSTSLASLTHTPAGGHHPTREHDFGTEIGSSPLARQSASAVSVRSPRPVKARPPLPRATSVPSTTTRPQPISSASLGQFRPKAAPRPGVRGRTSPSLRIPEHDSIDTHSRSKPNSLNTVEQIPDIPIAVVEEDDGPPPARPPKRQTSAGANLKPPPSPSADYDNLPADAIAQIQRRDNLTPPPQPTAHAIANARENRFFGGVHSGNMPSTITNDQAHVYHVIDDPVEDTELLLHNGPHSHSNRGSISSSQSITSQEPSGYDFPQNVAGAGMHNGSDFDSLSAGGIYDQPQLATNRPYSVGQDDSYSAGNNGMYATPVTREAFVPRNERSSTSLNSDQGGVHGGGGRRSMGSRSASAVSLASRGSVEDTTFFLPIPVSMGHTARREHLKAVMEGQPRGSYLIRFNCEKGLYVLSVKDIARIRNLWIENRRCQYQLSGQSFKTLFDLVAYFTDTQIIDDIGFRLTEPINVPDIVYRRHLSHS